MKVIVKFGKTSLEIGLEDSATTADLQSALEERTDVIARKQKLLFKGKVLSRDALLKDAGIKEGARVMLLASDGAKTKGQEAMEQKRTAQEKLAVAKAKVQSRLQQKPSPVQRTTDDQVRTWSQLKLIACREQGLTAFPMHALDVGARAERADFSHNSLREIPDAISRLSQLKALDLSKNELTLEGLGTGIFQLRELRKLYLPHNRLQALPSEMAFWVNLETLTLSHNWLKSLPDFFSPLKKLTELDLSHNHFTELPKSLGDCLRLRVLDVRHNALAHLPEQFSSLLHLLILKADHNRIHSVSPTLLRGCTSLVMLSLHGNPIVMEQFRETEGFAEYELRRQQQYDKKLDTGAMQPGERFDEGADHDPHT